MKKFAKMSLVAALAVAGTTASAQPLAEAIKNVDVTGTVVYRYDDLNWDDDTFAGTVAGTNPAVADTEGGATNNNYKVAVSLKSKVTDDVTFNSRFLVAAANGSFVGLDTNEQADANPGVTLSHANFAYTGIANTTVVVGKQGLATPWTKAIDSDGSEQTGTGILGMTTYGPVTAAAGYFNQTNLVGASDLVVAALIGNFGPITAEAWYLDVDNVLDSYFAKVSGKMGPVSAYIQYQDQDQDANNNDINLLKANVSAKLGIFNAGITYAKGGNEGTGILNIVATNSAIGYSVNAATRLDADAYFIDLGAQVTDKLHIGLNYDVVEGDTSTTNNTRLDHKEYYTQITYNHAKNLSTYVRLAKGDNEFQDRTDGDYTRGRLQVEYKF